MHEIVGKWESALRVLVTGVAGYTALVALLRVSGKRTLSKMNAFELVVTVALGVQAVFLEYGIAVFACERDVLASSPTWAISGAVGVQLRF